MNFFGTDGIRGSFGSTLTTGTAFLLGKSLALSGECPIVVVARDTRLSGEALYSALSDGVYDGGGNVINLGILPTNAVGHFTRKLGGDYGVMITASHNPPNDNGLKVFDRYGVKLCASKQRVLSKAMSSLSVGDACGVTEPVFYDIHNIYCEDVLRAISVDLSGVNVALDCCYGATYRVAPLVFGKAGASVTALCAKPNGKKINVGCGATVPDFLRSAMDGKHFDVGFSFDGDGDRLSVVQDGKVVPNGKVFYALAKHFKQTGALRHNAVVGTTLTNGGVEAALDAIGIKLLRSDVGDVNVFNLMAREGLTLGGEESGHYLLCDYATSSDAIINALAVCEVIRNNGSLWAYTEECIEVPSLLKSFPIAKTFAPTEHALAATIARVTQQYPSCRVVLRKSGTESKLRAYVEGEHCNDAMQALAATLGDNI